MKETNYKEMAKVISAGLEYLMTKDVLVKPLEVVKVQKQFEEPIVDKRTKKDGLDVNDYSKTRTVTKEVESNFKKGIVLSIPTCLKEIKQDFEVGDIVIFPKKFAIEYDLFKDSLLVKPYDIVAVVTEPNKDGILKLNEVVTSIIKDKNDISNSN